MENRPADVVVIGAACLDIKARLGQEIIPGTSNPGHVRISAGGCARNIAENLARLAVPVSLMSAVCRDDFGHIILMHTEQAGVQIDRVLWSCERHSAAYMALSNQQGDLLFGVDDTSGVDQLTPEYINQHRDILLQARFVMLDANVPVSTAQVIIDICGAARIPVGLDPVSYSLAQRYRSLVGSFALVTPNHLEAEALLNTTVSNRAQAIRAAKQLIGAGSAIAIITLAEQGLVYATSNSSGYVPAIPVDVVDFTGASDALTATVIYGILHQIPIDEAVRLGVSAATLTLGSSETVRQDLSLESLYAQLVI